MANIENRITGLVKAMKDISAQSDMSEADLKTFIQVLESIGGVSGQFAPKMSKIATAINQMSTALAGVGASEGYISRLKITLMGLATAYERTGVASQKMQTMSGLSPSMRTQGMRRFREEQAIQAKYFQDALVSEPPISGTGSAEEIQSQLAGRATALRLADELLAKINAQIAAEDQINARLREQSRTRREQIDAFALQPGLGQRYGAMRPTRVDPLASTRGLTPEQIQIAQASEYETLKSQTPGGRDRKQLFDPSMAEKQAQTTRVLTTEVERLEAAYEKLYFGMRKGPGGMGSPYGREAAIVADPAQAKRDALAEQGKRLSGETPSTRKQILEQYGEFMPGGGVGAENLEKKLQSLGVESARVTSVTQELSTGITSMSLSMDKGNNVVARGTVHIDKYGNVLGDTSRRFRGFTEAIGTNLIKVTQWAVATGLIYGAVRQLSQVFKEITEVQAKLAHVQIALGKSQGDLNQVFAEAINVANLTSSSVAGVIEAYAIAYRATGSYASEAERLAVTNNLLQESMILSKLAGIDQALSLDILVGALRQTGMELDQGRDLLDKWVYVSRQANVSLETLAQTYSIVGSTAQGVGIQMEELNALAATLAEATNLSATETGNALRGIISGFQSATSEKTLARFGLATRDATGQIRDFMGLYLELAQLTQSGILSDRDISEISQALGGGYRRAAQVETLLKNSQRVQQITNIQSEAGGSAAMALEIQMATLESAITRLGNAFTRFAQTLGDDSGFLGTITTVVDAMSSLFTVMTKLVAGMGKWTPYIAAFSAAWMVLGTGKGQEIFKGILGRPAGGALTGLASRYGVATTAQQRASERMAMVTGGRVWTRGGRFGPGDQYADRMAAVRMQPGARMPLPGGQGMQGAYTVGTGAQSLRQGIAGRIRGIDPLGFIIPALIAGGAFSSAAKMKKEDPSGAGLEAGRGVTSIIGAIVGGIVTAGNPLGMAAGSAMASAFYKGVVQYEDDLASFWAGVVRKSSEEEDEEKKKKKRRIDAQEMVGFGSRLTAGISGMAAGISQWLGASGEGGLFGTGIGSSKGTQALDPRAILTQQAQAVIAAAEGGPPVSGMYAAIFGLMDLETANAIVDQARQAMEGEQVILDVQFDMAEGIKELIPVVGPIIDEFMAEQQRKLVLGDISLPEFTKLPQILDSTKIATQMQKITTAADFAGMSVDVEDFTMFLLQLDEATRGYLTTLADDVTSSHRDWMKAMVEEKLTLEEIMALEDEHLEKLTRYEQMVPAVRQQWELQEIDRPKVFKVGRMTQAQTALAVKSAQAYTKAYYMEITKGNEKEADLMIQQLESFLVQYGEGIGASFGATIGGTTVDAMTQAIKDHDFSNLLQDVDFGFQDVRDSMSMGDIPGLMSQYQKVVGTFQTFFPDYDVEETEVGLITKDGLTTVHADLTLLNLAMQDLIDVNEQQLEGVWNIPSGMTAMVAWSSLFSRDVSAGGAVAGDDVWTEERKDGAVEPVSVLEGLEARLAQLDATIAGYQGLLEMGPKELGMQEFLASQQDLAGLETERDDLLQQIALTQMGQGLGITAVGDVSIADQLREALTIQNKIELNANIRLVVDGRTLANIVKQYLFEDLVSASDKVSGTGSGDYVIGH
jgi:TP901 family phage tail tape measure protein